MNNIVPATDPLQTLAREIEALANTADHHLIEAAMRVRELRTRIEAGEAGVGVKWFEWAAINIRLKPARLYELQTIAEAINPKIEMERLRKLNRERVKRFRDKEAEAKRMLEPERRAMIKWAKAALIEEVRRQLKQIERATMTRGNLITAFPTNSDRKAA